MGTQAGWCPRCGADPEVRLIQLGPAHGRGGPRPPPGRGHPPSRRRWLPLVGVLGVAWAVLALTAGTGGGSDRDPDAAAGTTTTQPEQATTARRESRPTTTAAPEMVPGAPLLGRPSGLAVVLQSERNRLLDLDTGLVLEMPRQAVVMGSSDNRLLVRTASGLEWWPAPFDGSRATPLGHAQIEQAWIQAGGDLLWLTTSGATQRVQLVTADGQVLADHQLPINTWTFGAVDGALVLDAPGGTFLLRLDGSIELVSVGDPVAAGGDRIYVHVCDRSLRCAVDVHDASGRLLETIEGPEAFGQPWNYTTAISPVGRVAHVVGDRYHLALAIDGEPVLELGLDAVNALAWSPDGRWLAVSTTASDVRFIDAVDGGPPLVAELDGGVGQPPPWQLFVVSTG